MSKLNDFFSKSRILLCFIAFLSVLLAITIIRMAPEKSVIEKTKVGLVIPGSKSSIGWNRSQYLGLKEACEELGIEYEIKENIPEGTGELGAAVMHLIELGCNLICLASHNYASEIPETIEEYKGISFYSSYTNDIKNNSSIYSVRTYQTRYLAGIVAGNETVTNKIGYIAAFNNCEINRSLNAFALGVQRVNPDAKVYVKWSNSWEDAEKEKKAFISLKNAVDIDIVTYHQNQPNILSAADAFGMKSIGYNNGDYDISSEKTLTSVVNDWKTTYMEIIIKKIQGRSNQNPEFWLGLSEGATYLSSYSPLVKEETKVFVEIALQELKNGIDVFYNKIYDNTGKVRCDDGECLSDEHLIRRMDWFVEGVEIYDGK